MIQAYEIRGNEFFIGNISAKKLVEEFGSPLYVYNEAVIRDRYRRLFESIGYSKKRIHYAMKANSNIRILQILEKEGAYIDAVSKEEVMIALKANYPAQRILFTGINLKPEDMKYAFENGVQLNLGSINQLKLYGELYPGSSVSIRINPDMGAGHHDHVITGGKESKFGIFYSADDKCDLDEIPEILKKYRLRLSGIHAHIGSGILDEKKYVHLMEVILNIAKKFPNLDFIDIGGGIGVPYKPGERIFNLKSFGKDTDELMRNFVSIYNSEPYLAIEPGRYLIAEAGIFLVTVTDIKDTPVYHFAGVDSGFNHLIRPMAYGSYHHIINVSNPEKEPIPVVVSGYICESGDVFTRTERGIEARQIPDPEVGDILAILNAGAYGYTMASNYNSRPRPAEVLITGGEARLIRKRETIENLLSTQV